MFDPATLALTGWWRASYAGSPWVPTASAGTSGANGNLTEATNPPATGAAVNGLTSADFDGAASRLGNASTMATLFDADGSLAVLFYADTATADSGATNPYTLPQLLGSADDYICLAFGSGGVRFGFYATAYGTWESAAVTAATGAWHLAQAKFDGANYSVRVDSGAWTTTAHAYSPDLGAGPLIMGRNGGGTVFFDGRILEAFTSDAALADADFNSIKSYVNSRYALSL